MNFGFGSPTTTAPPAFGTTQSSSFNFGAGDAENKSSFSFGGTPSNNKPGGFSFATPGATATAPASFNLSATSPPNFSFDAAKATPTNLTLASTTSAVGSPFSGYGLPQQPIASSPASGLNFNNLGATATSPQPTLGFGAVPSQPQFGFGLSAGAVTTTASTLPAFGTPTSSQAVGSGFSFGGSTGLTGFGLQFAGQPTSTTGQPLNFSQSPSFSLPKPITSIATSQPANLTLGATIPSPFGLPPLTSSAVAKPQAIPASAAPPGGTTFAPPASQPAKQPSLSFPSTLPAFQLGSASAPPASQLGSVPGTLGTTVLSSITPSTVSTGFQLPAATATPPTSTVPLGMITTAAPAVTAFQLTTSAPAVNFQLGSQTPVLQLGSTALKPAVQSTPTFTLSGISSAPNIGSTASAVPATSSMAPATSSGGLVGAFQPPITSGTAISGGASLTTSTILTAATAQPPSTISSMNFSQLEEMINKWTLDLEEQEKIFINQATQVNAWDRLLIANGEKIVQMNESIQNVQAEQHNLDHELDFVLAQQKELEELLLPLEKELAAVTVADPEREQMYNMAENIDTQLKYMSEDLKEVIEHLNESNRNQDSNDPIVQIGRILNAHMSSMQWIDSTTAQISTKLDQLTTMRNALRRDNERSFHLTYN